MNLMSMSRMFHKRPVHLIMSIFRTSDCCDVTSAALCKRGGGEAVRTWSKMSQQSLRFLINTRLPHLSDTRWS